MADIKQITPENFDSVVNGSLPVLVDFGHRGAVPAARSRPLLTKWPTRLAGKLAVAKCNVDDNQDLAMKFGVMSIPRWLSLRTARKSTAPSARCPRPGCRRCLRSTCNTPLMCCRP